MTDVEELAALRRRDEAFFAALVRRHQHSMLRVARSYVATESLAEEVVQDTWVAVIDGIDRFEGRARLTTWIYAILINRARSSGKRETRWLPTDLMAINEPSVPPEWFHGHGHDDARHWRRIPADWRTVPETVLESSETRRTRDEAIADLPPLHRAVITMRDVEGLTAQEACELLGLSEVNQRVVPHRARARVRLTLERHLEKQ